MYFCTFCNKNLNPFLWQCQQVICVQFLHCNDTGSCCCLLCWCTVPTPMVQERRCCSYDGRILTPFLAGLNKMPERYLLWCSNAGSFPALGRAVVRREYTCSFVDSAVEMLTVTMLLCQQCCRNASSIAMPLMAGVLWVTYSWQCSGLQTVVLGLLGCVAVDHEPTNCQLGSCTSECGPTPVGTKLQY